MQIIVVRVSQRILPSVQSVRRVNQSIITHSHSGPGVRLQHLAGRLPMSQSLHHRPVLIGDFHRAQINPFQVNGEIAKSLEDRRWNQMQQIGCYQQTNRNRHDQQQPSHPSPPSGHAHDHKSSRETQPCSPRPAHDHCQPHQPRPNQCHYPARQPLPASFLPPPSPGVPVSHGDTQSQRQSQAQIAAERIGLPKGSRCPHKATKEHKAGRTHLKQKLIDAQQRFSGPGNDEGQDQYLGFSAL